MHSILMLSWTKAHENKKCPKSSQITFLIITFPSIWVSTLNNLVALIFLCITYICDLKRMMQDIMWWHEVDVMWYTSHTNAFLNNLL